MMEKGPVSVRRGRRRGERMWMPEKARGRRGESSGDGGSGEWLVASGEWGPRASVGGEERFLASLEMTGGWGLEMTVFFSLMRRPERWSWLLKRSWREDWREWTARVA